MTIIAWIVLGLVAGALARLLVPGRDPMGLVATLVLGLAGSLVGGFLAHALFNDNDGVGLFGSVIGAVIILMLWHAFTRNRRGRMAHFSHRVVN